MNHPGLFKQRYEPLTGSDWLRYILPEDRQVFSMLGRSAADHGRAGGLALVQKRGREYMSRIGKRGALVTNLKRYFHQKAMEEMDL
jgi:hypothetical protein